MRFSFFKDHFQTQCNKKVNLIHFWDPCFRRVDSLNLETPYHFDYDPTTNRYPLEPEAYIEGQELYLHFFHEQVRNAGLAEDFCLEEDFK